MSGAATLPGLLSGILPGILIAALILDGLLGDPPWAPHPVRAFGTWALALEHALRALIPHPLIAGLLATGLLLAGVGGYTVLLFAVVGGGGWSAPASWSASLLAVLLLYWAVARQDLVRHAEAVRQALAAGDLPEARRRVAMIVGRDPERLGESDIVRATIESVAENTVDGITAPILWAAAGAILGAGMARPEYVAGVAGRDGAASLAAVAGLGCGAILYRAINTLDSTYGYRNARYRRFGTVAARLDDLANWLPARLTAPVMVLLAPWVGGSTRAAWRTLWRDGRKHASPNAGLCEASMAGALGLPLGGPVWRHGAIDDRPWLGWPRVGTEAASRADPRPSSPPASSALLPFEGQGTTLADPASLALPVDAIRRACRLMTATVVAITLFGGAILLLL